jgi:acyl-coenzyme A thioesterase PaaI-like protein
MSRVVLLPAGAIRRRPRLLGLYGPFLGAGIRIEHASPALDRVRVRMPLRWWNRNLLGTHFGGSLYAMCDPFFLWMLMEALGPGYVVWDKAATIRFRRPARGLVTAEFVMPERVAEIRAAADAGGKVEPTFTARVVDSNGEVVAEVDKLLHVRRAPAAGRQ